MVCAPLQVGLRFLGVAWLRAQDIGLGLALQAATYSIKGFNFVDLGQTGGFFEQRDICEQS